MTRNLWRAEWLKTRRSPVNKLLYRGLLIIIAFVYAVLTIVTLSNPEEQMPAARGSLPFPGPSTSMNGLFPILGPILAMIFVAASVGHEYTRDTWKMVIPRYGSRIAFLVTKLASTLLWMVVMLLSLVAVGTIAGLIAALILGIDLVDTKQLTSYLLSQQLVIAGMGLLSSAFYGLLTLLLTVLSRSTIAGVGTGFILMIMNEPLSAGLRLLWEPLARAWPLPHINNLMGHWIDEMKFMKQGAEFVFGGPITPTQSLLTLLAWMAFFVAGSFYLFRKRDMAG